MTEIVEEDSEHRQGQGTETALRDTALYENLFQASPAAAGRRFAGRAATSPNRSSEFGLEGYSARRNREAVLG